MFLVNFAWFLYSCVFNVYNNVVLFAFFYPLQNYHSMAFRHQKFHGIVTPFPIPVENTFLAYSPCWGLFQFLFGDFIGHKDSMGPKKGGKGGKKDKGGGGGEEGGAMDAETQAKMFMMTCQSLQLQMADRTEDASRALAAKRELQSRVTQMSSDLEEEQNRTFEVTKAMTTQYKGMQEMLLSKINNLEETIQEMNDRLTDSEIKYERMSKDKDVIIHMKDDEIAELKAKMDDMAEEFGEMLRETLDKMRERIEVSSGQIDSSDMPIKTKMSELKLDDHK
jgi:hypothetical protein